MAEGTATLTINIHFDGSGFAAAATAFSEAFTRVGIVGEQAQANIAALQDEMRRARDFDELARWQRRQRRYSSHVFETRARSGMHSAYRAKTRRRRRRG